MSALLGEYRRGANVLPLYAVCDLLVQILRPNGVFVAVVPQGHAQAILDELNGLLDQIED